MIETSRKTIRRPLALHALCSQRCKPHMQADTHNAEILRTNEELSKEIRKYQDSPLHF